MKQLSNGCAICTGAESVKYGQRENAPCLFSYKQARGVLRLSLFAAL
nr:MAG TPA: hypothetical protein [Caudoviricetes sp.]